MITMLFGYPGGGKSYTAVAEFIIPSMKKGMHVYSSLAGFNPFIAGSLHGVDPTLYHQISPDDFLPWETYDVQAGALFVFDEVQNLYGASNHKDHLAEREKLKRFLSMHRHAGHAVVAICQEPSTVDKFFRDLTEHFTECRKMNMVFGEKTKTYSMIHRKGGTGKSNKPIKQETKQYKDVYTVCYQSTIPGVDESQTKSDTIRINPLKILGPAILTLLILIASVGIFLYQRKEKNENQESSNMVNVQAVAGKYSTVEANGWLSDSLCVRWLWGSVEVAQSCPDLSVRSGRIRCRDNGGDSCLVVLRSGEMVGTDDSRQAPAMEPQGRRVEGGSPPAPGF